LVEVGSTLGLRKSEIKKEKCLEKIVEWDPTTVGKGRRGKEKRLAGRRVS
jgi:hypothetical protein